MTVFCYPKEQIKQGLTDSHFLPILKVNALPKNNIYSEFLFCVFGTWLLVAPFIAFFANLPSMIKIFSLITLFYCLSVMLILFIRDNATKVLPEKARAIAEIPELKNSWQDLVGAKDIYGIPFRLAKLWTVIILVTPEIIRTWWLPKNKASPEKSRASPSNRLCLNRRFF